MKSFHTHISGLDELLGDGFPVGTYLVIGSPGSGIELFVREIAFYRAKYNPIKYITLNSSPDKIREEMVYYRHDLSVYEENGNWEFKVIEDLLSLEKMINPSTNKKTIIIDSLSDILSEKNGTSVIKLIKTLTNNWNREQEPLFLLLTEGMQDSKLEVSLQHYVDGVILFSSVWEENRNSKKIIIKKTPTKNYDRPIPYTISKNGLKIETSLRIA